MNVLILADLHLDFWGERRIDPLDLAAPGRMLIAIDAQ